VKLIINKFNKTDELKLLLETELKIIELDIVKLEKNLNITRTNIIQKITLNEMYLQRLLTNVATVILPLSLVVGIVSLPYKNIPFKENENGLIILILILLIIGYILYYLMSKYKYELL
jgi:Mg2+ and Co2+ transporter CorA